MGGRILILLDTHVLLWFDQESPRLGPDAKRQADVAFENGELAISAFSFWEVAVLDAKERVTMKLPLPNWRADFIAAGLVEVPVDGQIGIVAGGLDSLHGDPADRLIVATAIETGSTLLTADRRLLDWDGLLERLDATR